MLSIDMGRVVPLKKHRHSERSEKSPKFGTELLPGDSSLRSERRDLFNGTALLIWVLRMTSMLI